MNSQFQSFSWRTLASLTGFSILVSIGLVFVMMANGPILQDPGYHNFTDQRTYLGLGHFWNVITNLPYIIVGIAGLLYPGEVRPAATSPAIHRAFRVFFFFLILTGLGSGYYHLDPTNSSLFWDRLPLAAAFMAFMDLVICAFGPEKTGNRLLLPLVTLGITSVLVWKFGEGRGAGDFCGCMPQSNSSRY